MEEGLLPEKGRSSYKGYVKVSSWIDMIQARAIWLINLNQGVDIKLNKARKTHEIQFNLTYTRESLWGKSSIKFKRSMKLLLKDMAGLKGDSQN